MVSEFNDPNVPKIDELGHPGPSDETKHYWGTVYWTAYEIDRLGNAGPGIDKDRRVRFRSHRKSPIRRQLCELNQIIKGQHINASITRQLKKVETHEWIAGATYGRPVIKRLKRTDFEVIHID